MKKDFIKRILGIAAMAVAAGLLILIAVLTRDTGGEENAGSAPEAGSGSYTDSSGDKTTLRDFAMGSLVTVTLYGEKEEREAAAGTILTKIQDLDQNVISWREVDSELAKWNNEAPTEESGREYEVSNTLYQAVYQGWKLYELSSGALDLTLRPVLNAWGIEEKTPDTFQVPTEQELQEAASHCGMKELTFRDKEIGRVRKDITLDLGSIGKGYALDIAYQYLTLGDHSTPVYIPEQLRNSGKTAVTGGVISVGGSVMVFGSRPDGKEFQVGVRDPDGQPEDLIGIISIPAGGDGKYISTSGGYEKYIEKDGVRYHHIIDPGTLKPAETGLRSVTVVCGDETDLYGGLTSDGLSTACFILGETKALGVLEKCHAEAVLIREDGSILVTDGLKDHWKKLP